MFKQFSQLKPLKDVADLLAFKVDWSALYDLRVGGEQILDKLISYLPIVP